MKISRRFNSIVACITLVLAAGCTHLKLERSTLRQGSTIPDLHFQQILSNLATFAENPESLAWHLKLKSGTIQITDLGAAAVGGSFGRDVTITPGVNAQRTSLGQWDVEPATDADELEVLQLAYKKAVRPMDVGVDAELRLQLWQLVLTYDIAPGASTVLAVMKDAVAERFGDLTKMVNKLPADPSSAQIKTDLIKAGASLALLIDLQLTYNFPRSQDPLAFAAYLKDPSLYAMTPLLPFSPEEMEYARQFNAAVAEYQRLLVRVATLASSLPGEAAEAFRRQISYMDHESELRTEVQLLNPVRERDIDIPPRPTPPGPFPAQVRFLQSLYSRNYLIPPVRSVDRRNAGLADQAQAKVEKLKELVEEDSPFQTPWFGVGCKDDVPPCTCYVGRSAGCAQDIYLWVLPKDLATLRRFTVIVQTLAPIEKQDTFTGNASQGAAFSPGLH
jgi:hypothetical protein